MTVIADTGYVVAVAIDTDRKHAACMAQCIECNKPSYCHNPSWRRLHLC